MLVNQPFLLDKYSHLTFLKEEVNDCLLCDDNKGFL